MKIAGLTVYDKRGTGYCANNLTVAVRNHPTEHGQQSVLHFISSGVLITLAAEDVDRIEWTPNGWQHCNACDQSLWSVLGAGIAANDVPASRT